MLHISIVSTAQQAATLHLHDSVCVVIDVFRATSVMVNALRNGAARVLPVATIDEALALRSSLAGNVILGGERGSVRIDGFDLDNSPLAYTPQAVKGCTIVMTTTNGTLAISACSKAAHLYIASMFNYEAVAKAVAAVAMSERRPVVIVCAGNEGVFAAEDAVCAALLSASLAAFAPSCFADDATSVLTALSSLPMADLIAIVERGQHSVELSSKGFADDVLFCLSQAQCPVAPSRHADGFIYAGD